MPQPIIYKANEVSLDQVLQKHSGAKIFDPYDDLLEELFLIRNPKFKFIPEYANELKSFVDEFCGEDPLKHGSWVYFEWADMIVHYLPDIIHQELHTARNKNLITQDEQEKFYNFSIGVAGLSVGSHGAVTTALMGGARKIKLADPDILSPTNLNRNRYTFTQIGKLKTHLVAEYIYQLNPYAEIHCFDEGLTESNLSEFLDGLDLVVEELDEIKVKGEVRKMSRKLKIPVIMATDNADSVIMDIERYDIDPELPIFHGLITEEELEAVNDSPQNMYNAMAKIIDVSMVPSRVLHSVTEVGKSLYSWPQLASAATMSGAVIAYVIRKIAIGEMVNSGKTEISIEKCLDPNFDEDRRLAQKEASTFLDSLK